MLLLLVMGSAGLRAQTYYVFLYKGTNNVYNFLYNNNGTIGNTTTFNENTCLFTLNGSYLTSTASSTTSNKLGRNGNSLRMGGGSAWTIDSYHRLKTDNNYYLNYNSGWTMTSTDSPGTSAKYTVAYNYTSHPAELTLSAISGEQSISTTGTYNYSANASSVPEYSLLEGYNGTNYYYYSSTMNTAAPTAVTAGVTKTWSVSGAGASYVSINASTGVLTVNSMPSAQTSVTITCTASKSGYTSEVMTLDVYLSPSGTTTESGMYVITNGTYYLGGTSTDRITPFNPATCLWTKDNNNYWTNTAGYHLYTYSPFELSNTGQNPWELVDSEDGNQGYGLKRVSAEKWIRYNNNAWEITTKKNRGRIVFAVTKNTYGSSATAPTINNGDAQITSTGTNNSFTKTNAAYTRGYIDYVFRSNASHLFELDNSTSINAVPTADVFGYTWSLEGISSDYATINSSTGVITYSNYVSSDVDATVKLTATSANHTYVVTQSVTFKPAVSPARIVVTSDNPMTVYVGHTAPVTYALEPFYAYDHVTYQSASTGTATVAADGTVTGVAVGQTTITLNAARSGGSGVAASATVTVNVRDKVAEPVIAFTPNGASATATITCSTPGSTIKYTVNGGAEQTYSGPFTVNTNDVVTAYATSANSYFDPSDVATSGYSIATGVADGVVTLNDMEDHTWTYYAGIPADVDPGTYNTTYLGRLYSPNPRNVKITYKGNGRLANNNAVTGVKVGIDADAHTFVYYKTLEDNGGYKYTTIPNPFSVRPKVGTTYYGFSHWRVASVSGGSISGKAVGGTINADEEITFVPTRAYTTNCISMEVELEAVWDVAEVSTSGTFTNNYGVERMFYVFTSNSTSNITANSKACTYTSIYPNGTTNGTTAATMSNRKYRRGGFTCSADSKFEYIYLDNNSSTMNANGHNLTIGRGVSNHDSRGVCANKLIGTDVASSNLNFKIRLESGKYNYFAGLYSAFTGQSTDSRTFGGVNKVQSVLGSDYDRAQGDNDKLTIVTEAWMGGACYFSEANNATQGYYKCWLKSGRIITAELSDGSGGTNAFYIGTSGTQKKSLYIYPRYLYMEGGEAAGVAGGLDDTAYTDSSAFRVLVRMTGGYIRGCLYGAGSYARGKGERRYVITGGEIGGWIASGCNGIGGNTTEDNNGQTRGDGYMYIGGTAAVGYKNATVNSIEGGNIFGAGRGASGKSYAVGTMNNSNIVIADDARVEKNVYGGGNYGFVFKNGTATIYVVGGTVDGSIFGGSNMQQGQTVDIIMTDGLVKSGIYGGSNTEGTINKNVSIRVTGGQVGTENTRANIHGGGYGSSTGVTRNVDVTIGKSGAAAGPVVYGDVYGGSALGKVNGTAATNTYHTHVTMNAGIVHGDIYGGGLGDASNAANVYGPVTVNIHGGEAERVFGCNNTNGRPMQNTNHVNMDGGQVGYIYGGGNAAPYTGTPYVDMTGGTVINHVFGGGLGTNAKITGSTNVTIRDNANVLKNVYGGGNAAEVTGDTYVKVK